jgi:TonB family protein
MVLIRKCLIGSIIFHLVALGWVGLCRSRPVFDQSNDSYLKIYIGPETKPQASSGPERQTTAQCLSKPNSVAITDAPSPKLTRYKPAESSQRTADIAKKATKVAKRTVVSIPVNSQPASGSQALGLTAAATKKGSVDVCSGPSLKPQPPKSPSEVASEVVAAENFTKEIKPQLGKGVASARLSGAAGDGPVETDLTDVDVHSVKINCPKPSYPLKARKFNWEGIVILEGEVKTNGRMGKVKVVKSSGYDILDQEARLTVKGWRYRPALKDGKPIRCQRRIPIIFNLED